MCRNQNQCSTPKKEKQDESTILSQQPGGNCHPAMLAHLRSAGDEIKQPPVGQLAARAKDGKAIRFTYLNYTKLCKPVQNLCHQAIRRYFATHDARHIQIHNSLANIGGAGNG